MILESIATHQYAGLTEKSYQLTPGMNVLCEPNESGKTTMLKVLHDTLFQGKKFRVDSDFARNSFPAGTLDGTQPGDSIDGEIVFTDRGSRFDLSRVWFSASPKDSRVLLKDETTGRLYRDEDTVSKVLKDHLIFGQGIYDYLILATQKESEEALRQLLGGRAKAAVRNQQDMAADLSSFVSLSMNAAGGINLSRFEQLLQERRSELILFWDEKAGIPTGGRSNINRYKHPGKICGAWYDLQDAKERQRSARQAEENLASAQEALERAEKTLNQAQKSYQELLANAEKIRSCGEVLRLLTEIDEKTALLMEDRKRWPELEHTALSGKALKREWTLAKARDLHLQRLEAKKEVAEAKKALSDAGGVIPKEDMEKAADLAHAMEVLQARLGGMKVSAKAWVAEDTKAEVTPIGGETRPLTSGEFTLDQAAVIEIPGQIRLVLTPEGVDANALVQEGEEKKQELRKILDRYSVQDTGKLRSRAERAGELSEVLKGKEDHLAALPDEQESLPDFQGVRQTQDVENDIEAFTKGEDLPVVLAEAQEALDALGRKYRSRENLNSQLRDLAAAGEEAKQRLKQVTDLPDSCLSIRDIDTEMAARKRSLENAQNLADKAKDDFLAAGQQMPEKTEEELAEETRQKEKILEDLVKTNDRLKRIQETYGKVRKQRQENPYGKIEEKFEENLKTLSGGRDGFLKKDGKGITDVTVTSGSTCLTPDLLSEGTKDTIRLAFRLAVLEALMPEGGPVVFDDPLTDMDPERKREACTLLGQFAKKGYQVIFMTCDPRYRDLLKTDESVRGEAYKAG